VLGTTSTLDRREHSLRVGLPHEAVEERLPSRCGVGLVLGHRRGYDPGEHVREVGLQMLAGEPVRCRGHGLALEVGEQVAAHSGVGIDCARGQVRGA
jgi:hypothetical protein